MATWNYDVTQIIRHIINDTEAPQVYTDARIKTAAVIAANFVARDITLGQTYTISIYDETITPDPNSDPTDFGFVNLIGIRGAILILQGQLKQFAVSSMRVTDGPSSIDVAGIFSNTKKLIDDLLLSYSIAKNKYVMGSSGYGKSVLSPTIDTSIMPGYYNDRRS